MIGDNSSGLGYTLGRQAPDNARDNVLSVPILVAKVFWYRGSRRVIYPLGTCLVDT